MGGSGPARLLVVDDEERVREVLASHFSREGYDCRTAPGAAEALESLRAAPCDLVLSDIMTPGDSSLALLKEIQVRHRETCVVMIAEAADTQAAIDAVKLGAYDYITKPLQLEATQGRVERALKRRELSLENDRYRSCLESVFRRYLSPEVMSYVLLDRPLEDLKSRLLDATVLFCDIRGFSGLFRGTDAQELLARLNQAYFEPATEAIMAHKGMVNKFLGDGIMAVFGAPLSYEGHAVCALQAAREILERVHARSGAGLPGFPLGIGLASGEVLAGDVGGPRHMDYTVMGEAVNSAAYLEKAAKPGEILMNEAAFRACGSPSGASTLRLAIKGQGGPSAVYSLDGPRA